MNRNLQTGTSSEVEQPLASKRVWPLTDAGAGVAAGGERRYHAFPSVLVANGEDVLVAYKNGIGHMNDITAPLELLTIHAPTGDVAARLTVDATEGRNNQNPELLRMPDGTILILTDLQASGHKQRVGLHIYASADGGATFEDRGPFPRVGGYQFGYAFDDAPAADEAGAVVVLNMTFAELEGGVRAVHAIRTSDSGRTWSYIRNLNEEFGYDFNESTLLQTGDGYLIAARGYDRTTRAYRTDRDFRKLAEIRWTECPRPIAFTGRPKLFVRDGSTYLVCRNVPQGKNNGDLMLYEIDAGSLAVVSEVQLDTNDDPIGDSYYAEGYFAQGAPDEPVKWNVITYAPPAPGLTPDIIRIEFEWEELLARLDANRTRYGNPLP